MELWIRSQNKTILSKAHDLVIREDRNENNETNYFIVDTYTLGIYKTKERALEVLDEISNKIKKQYLVKVNGLIRPSELEKERIYLEKEYNGEFIMNPPMYDINPLNPNIVYYEMPKE